MLTRRGKKREHLLRALFILSQLLRLKLLRLLARSRRAFERISKPEHLRVSVALVVRRDVHGGGRLLRLERRRDRVRWGKKPAVNCRRRERGRRGGSGAHHPMFGAGAARISRRDGLWLQELSGTPPKDVPISSPPSLLGRTGRVKERVLRHARDGACRRVLRRR